MNDLYEMDMVVEDLAGPGRMRARRNEVCLSYLLPYINVRILPIVLDWR